MYSYYDDSVILITQGNDVTLNISVTSEDTGEAITLGDEDYVLLTVENKKREHVIQKKLTNQDQDPDTRVITCPILSEDTMSLPTGEYPYDCLYSRGGLGNTTFIKSSIIIARAIGKVTDVPRKRCP